MTWVCPEGMGHVALMVCGSEVRRLNELPHDVEVVRGLPHFERHPPAEHERDWRHQPPWDEPRPIYLHVKHRYFVRIGPGELLMIMGLGELLEHYRCLESREREA